MTAGHSRPRRTIIRSVPCRRAVSGAVASALVAVAFAACRPSPPPATSTPATATPPAAPAAGPPLNVVLVTVDTLRADRLTEAIAPELTALARRGVRFTAARTAVPLTLPSHATLLTGQLPPAHGVRLNGQRLADDVPTLATALDGAGYRTGAFVGAYVLDRRFGLGRGFDTYDDAVARDWQRADRLEAERPGAAVVDAALAWLEGGPGPFFLWVHLYDPHAPYTPPAPFATQFPGRPYDGEVAYASAQVARLVARLESQGRLADTVILLAGDHGEGLGAHGEATHGMLAYDATLRVPLAVVAPGLAPATIDAPVSLADVAPAVLRLSHAPASLPAASSRDLLGGRADAEVYAETEYPSVAGWHPLRVVAGRTTKLIRSGALELYDLAADPDERADRAAQDPAAARAALGRLTAIAPATSRVAAAAPDAQAKLRALGYASGPSAQTAAGDAPNPATVIDGWTRYERLTSAPPTAATAAALGELVRAHPRSYVFATSHAQTLSALGRHRDAAEALRRAVAQFPAEASLFHDLSVAARAAGDLEEARKAEDAAIALDDTNAAAHHGRGLLLVESGRAGEALGAFTRAVEIDPTNASYWADLGNAYRDDGDVQQADRAYGRALQADPAHADAANGRGVLLVQAGRPADAVAWFERALTAAPDLVEARLNLGIAYQQSGQRERAVAAYRQVLARAPKSAARERQAATELLRGLK